MRQRIRNIFSSLLRHLTPVRMVVAILVLVFFWFVILGDKGIYQLRQLLDMKYKLIADRQRLNDEIDRLSLQRELLSDTENLETIIRSELGYIKPGEVVFEERRPLQGQ